MEQIGRDSGLDATEQWHPMLSTPGTCRPPGGGSAGGVRRIDRPPWLCGPRQGDGLIRLPSPAEGGRCRSGKAAPS